MTTEQLTTVLGPLFSGLPALIAVYLLVRKAPHEVAGIRAEANADNASASKALAEASALWLRHYHEMVDNATQRDAEVLGYSEDIKLLKTRVADLEAKYDIEHDKRIDAEKRAENAEKQAKSAEARANGAEAKVTLLTKRVQELEKQVKELQTNPKTTTQPIEPIKEPT